MRKRQLWTIAPLVEEQEDDSVKLNFFHEGIHFLSREAANQLAKSLLKYEEPEPLLSYQNEEEE